MKNKGRFDKTYTPWAPKTNIWREPKVIEVKVIEFFWPTNLFKILQKDIFVRDLKRICQKCRPLHSKIHTVIYKS